MLPYEYKSGGYNTTKVASSLSRTSPAELQDGLVVLSSFVMLFQSPAQGTVGILHRIITPLPSVTNQHLWGDSLKALELTFNHVLMGKKVKIQ